MYEIGMFFSIFCSAGLLYLDTMHYSGVSYISFGYNEDYNIPIMEFIIIKWVLPSNSHNCNYQRASWTKRTIKYIYYRYTKREQQQTRFRFWAGAHDFFPWKTCSSKFKCESVLIGLLIASVCWILVCHCRSLLAGDRSLLAGDPHTVPPDPNVSIS